MRMTSRLALRYAAARLLRLLVKTGRKLAFGSTIRIVDATSEMPRFIPTVFSRQTWCIAPGLSPSIPDQIKNSKFCSNLIRMALLLRGDGHIALFNAQALAADQAITESGRGVLASEHRCAP